MFKRFSLRLALPLKVERSLRQEAAKLKLPRSVVNVVVITIVAMLMGACAPGIETVGETTPQAPAQALPVVEAAMPASPQPVVETVVESLGTSAFTAPESLESSAVDSTMSESPATPESIAPVFPTESTGSPFTPVGAEPAYPIDAVGPGEQELTPVGYPESAQPDSQEVAGSPGESEAGEPVAEPEVQEPQCAPGYFWVEDID